MPALRYCFALQSCLCPTPELRSFHMGIALSTLFALPRPLRTVALWLRQHVNAEGTFSSQSTSHVRNKDLSPSRSTHLHGGMNEPAPHPLTPTAHRPLRGNWPFTVRPPAPSPVPTPAARQCVSAHRGFLPTPSASNRDAFFAALATDGMPKQRSARMVRRVSDAGSGRLVIAGRMADVCAELDRMAAAESA